MSHILAGKRSKHKIFLAYRSKLIYFRFILRLYGLSFEQYLVVAKHQVTRVFQNILRLSTML